jgi:hypothetical protein
MIYNGCFSISMASQESKHLIQGDNLDVRVEPSTPAISKKVHFDQARAIGVRAAFSPHRK